MSHVAAHPSEFAARTLALAALALAGCHSRPARVVPPAPQNSSAEAEVHAKRARADDRLAAWANAITMRIKRAWLVPLPVTPALSCELHVTVKADGQVTGVRLGACNGDAAVQESIVKAVYRAAPLPLPADPALFDPNLIIIFAP
jgi:colicin import membrane protein